MSCAVCCVDVRLQGSDSNLLMRLLVMSKTSRKFRQKVQALKKINGMPDMEAQAMAKVAKLVRMKGKRLILRGPSSEIIGHFTINGDKIQFQTAAGVEPKIEDGCIVMNMPKEKKAKDEKKTKKVKNKKKVKSTSSQQTEKQCQSTEKSNQPVENSCWFHNLPEKVCTSPES